MGLQRTYSSAMKFSALKSLNEIAVGAQELIGCRELGLEDARYKHITAYSSSFVHPSTVDMINAQRSGITKSASGATATIPRDHSLPSYGPPLLMLPTVLFWESLSPLAGTDTSGWTRALFTVCLVGIKRKGLLYDPARSAFSQRHVIL